MIDWLAHNKEWVFSGIGVLVITLVIGGIRWIASHRRREAKPPPPTIHNEARDVNDSTVYQAGRDIHVNNSATQVTTFSLLHLSVQEHAVPPGSQTAATGELDHVKRFIEQHDLRPAWALLDRIDARFAGDLTPYEAYRLLANRGHIRRLEGNIQEAARLYLAAKARRPDLEDAESLEAMAYHFMGDNPRAHSLAEQLRAKYPESERIMNIWIVTADPARHVADLELAVPEHHHNDAEVALAARGKSRFGAVDNPGFLASADRRR